MAETLLDQLKEKVPDYVERGLKYTRSRQGVVLAFLASDILHDVVIKFKRLKERKDIDDIYDYFLGALDREAIRYATRFLRRRERQMDLKDDLTPSDEPTPTDEIERVEEKAEAAREVARLYRVSTPEEREVLQLLRNGLSRSEIAAQLGITGSAVRMRLLHLRKRYGRRSAREDDSSNDPQAAQPAPVLVSSSSDLVSSAA